MPFTFAHPAVVLPLLRKKGPLSTSGLIVGSLVPDFEGFLRMEVNGNWADSWPGILLFNIPVAIGILFLYHGLVKHLFLRILPYFLATRLVFSLTFNWVPYFRKHWVRVLISILLGVFTHLLWDDFTHYDGYIVNYYYDFFYRKLWGISLFNVFQFVSSVLGIILVFWFVLKLPEEKAQLPSLKYRLMAWGFMGLLTAIFLSIRGMYGFQELGSFVFSAIGCFFGALIALSIALRIFPSYGLKTKKLSGQSE
jgi:hypothetical protein